MSGRTTYMVRCDLTFLPSFFSHLPSPRGHPARVDESRHEARVNCHANFAGDLPEKINLVRKMSFFFDHFLLVPWEYQITRLNTQVI